MDQARICRLLEVLRWVGVVAGFVLAYPLSGATAQLHVLAPWLAGSLAGLTGIESVFFGEAAAKITGYAPSAYQRQSGFNNLALAAVALTAYALNWGPAADLAVTSVLLVFLVLSAGNHLWSGFRDGNMSLRGVTRPAATLVLVLVTLPILWSASASMGS